MSTRPTESIFSIRPAWRALQKLDGQRKAGTLVQNTFDTQRSSNDSGEKSDSAEKSSISEKMIDVAQGRITDQAKELLDNPLITPEETEAINAAIEVATEDLLALSRLIVKTKGDLRDRQKQAELLPQPTSLEPQPVVHPEAAPTVAQVVEMIQTELIDVKELPPEVREEEIMNLVTPEVTRALLEIQGARRSAGSCLLFLEACVYHGKDLAELTRTSNLGQSPLLELFIEAKKIALTPAWEKSGLAATIDALMQSRVQGWEKLSAPESKESLLKKAAEAIDKDLSALADLLTDLGFSFLKTDIVRVMKGAEAPFKEEVQEVIDQVYSQFQELSRDIPRVTDAYSVTSLPTYDWLRDISSVPLSPTVEDIQKLQQQKQEYSQRFQRIEQALKRISQNLDQYTLTFDKSKPNGLRALLARIDEKIAEYDKLAIQDQDLARTLPAELGYVDELYRSQIAGRRSPHDRPGSLDQQAWRFGFDVMGNLSSFDREIQTRRAQCGRLLENVPDSRSQLDREFDARQKQVVEKLIKGVKVQYGWKLSLTQGGELTYIRASSQDEPSDADITHIADLLSGKKQVNGQENTVVQVMVRAIQNPDVIQQLYQVEELRRTHISGFQAEQREDALRQLQALSTSSGPEGVVQLAKIALAEIDEIHNQRGSI